MIRLTDKEIQIVKDSVEKPRVPDDLVEAIELSRRLIKETYVAIAQAQIKKFREWLKDEVLEDCHDGYSNVMCFHKRALKELLDEVKE